jgi:glycosyltransferase involved in cell wall biosynthesis
MSKSPRIVAILPGFITSTIMNVINPMLLFQKQNEISFKVIYEPYFQIGKLSLPDLVLFCRNTEPAYSTLDKLFLHKIPYIYDLDDNFFDIPFDHELAKYHRTPERIAMLTKYLENAQIVRVYSQPLLDRVRPLNPNVDFVKASINWPIINSTEPAKHPNLIKIVYPTSRREDPLVEIFVPALEIILKKYKNNVLMTFWGGCPKILANYPNVRHLRFNSNYNHFLKKFSGQGFDIGLAPMLSDPFFLSKTNNKFREYAACGIAGIYTNVEIYSEVQSGTNGILVDNSVQAWINALEQLISDGQFRTTIGKNAKQFAQNNYPLDDYYNIWRREIQTALQSSISVPRITDTSPSSYSSPVVMEKGRASTIIKTKKKSKILPAVFNQIRNILWMLRINLIKKI